MGKFLKYWFRDIVKVNVFILLIICFTYLIYNGFYIIGAIFAIFILYVFIKGEKVRKREEMMSLYEEKMSLKKDKGKTKDIAKSIQKHMDNVHENNEQYAFPKEALTIIDELTYVGEEKKIFNGYEIIETFDDGKPKKIVKYKDGKRTNEYKEYPFDFNNSDKSEKLSKAQIKDRQVYTALRAYTYILCSNSMLIDGEFNPLIKSLVNVISKKEIKKLSTNYSFESEEFKFVYRNEQNFEGCLNTFNENEKLVLSLFKDLFMIATNAGRNMQITEEIWLTLDAFYLIIRGVKNIPLERELQMDLKIMYDLFRAGKLFNDDDIY